MEIIYAEAPAGAETPPLPSRQPHTNFSPDHEPDARITPATEPDPDIMKALLDGLRNW